MANSRTVNGLDAPVVVLKFGGSSLSNVQLMRNAANRIIDAREKGNYVVVVVSAMAGETDRLLKLGLQFGDPPDEYRQRELDALVSTGEQVSAALVAMALLERGVPARSFTASQIKVHADSRFQSARIRSIDSTELLSALSQGKVVVVTGFQGVDDEGSVVTLGRGGSDTTAVAFAVALGAQRCEIFTDVKGVFTADPSIYPGAKLLKTIFFEEMIELASSGASVLQIRSVELAMKNAMEIHVRSSFSEVEGTRVISEINGLEALVVTGIAHDDNQTKVSVVGLENRSDILARVLEPLADANIVVDLITQNIGVDGKMTIAFTIEDKNWESAKACLDRKTLGQELADIRVQAGLVKISVVGIGMRTHSGVAHKVFALLSNKKIPILMGLSTEIKVTCLIPKEFRDDAVTLLHEGLGLHNNGLG